MQAQRFICDGMLGKLARWLRLAGYDTMYLNTPDKMRLVRISRSQGRCLLTRDTRLAARFPEEACLISSDRFGEQFRQVRDKFHVQIVPERLGTRCSLCNEPLVSVAREAVADRVPAYTWARQKEFRECPVCRRVYWQGDHWKRMKEVFSSL